MLVIPGKRGKDNCDGIVSRRELLRIGGSGVLGLTLADVLAHEGRAKDSTAGGPGYGGYTNILRGSMGAWSPRPAAQEIAAFYLNPP